MHVCLKFPLSLFDSVIQITLQMSSCVTLIKLGNRHKRIRILILLFSEYFFLIYSEVAVFLCDVIRSGSNEVLHNLGSSSMEKNHICLSHTMLFSVYKHAEFGWVLRFYKLHWSTPIIIIKKNKVRYLEIFPCRFCLNQHDGVSENIQWVPFQKESLGTEDR